MFKAYLIPFLLLFLIVSSCKKNETASYSINGQVRDGHLNTGVANATVLLEVKELSGGNFNNSFKTLATTTTDGNGNYSFNFERVNASEYRINVSKNLHFNSEIVINPDDLSTDNDNIRNFTLNSMAWIRVHLQNTNPSNANDKIIYQLTDGAYSCGICCGTADLQLEGTNVDTTFVCLNDGSHNVTGTGFVTKNGQNSTINKTVFLTPQDTTDITILY